MDRTRDLRTIGDVALALGLTVLYQLEVWLPGWGQIDDPDVFPTPAAQATAAAVGLALTLSLLVRRRFPLLPLALAFPTLAVTGPGGLDGTPALLLVLVAVLVSVGAEARDTAALVGAVGVGGLIAIAILRDPDARLDLGDLLLPVLTLGGAWAVGVAFRVRRDRELALERRTAALERDRADEARAAVADERSRIARELHDVVAHAIGVIVVQARGGRAALPTDREATRAALDAIEATGVQALAEMHRFVRVLRVDDDPDTLEPTPGLRDLDRLLARVRDAGLPVELEVEGEPVDIAAGVDLSAYRIVQEALTNALRHAGAARAQVRIRYGRRDLDLEISDTGRGEPAASRAAGLGLVGMRERATLVGGSLEAEPVDGGGFIIHARLPIGPDAR